MTGILDHFTAQANACRDLGSPFTGRVIDLFSAVLTSDTKTGRRLLEWSGNIRDDVPALRLAGGLHRLVLSNRDEALADLYRTRSEDQVALASALAQSIAVYDDELSSGLDSPPQTNEVGRSAMLLPGFLWLARRFECPFDLIELGASAGANLFFDHWHYRYGPESWGDPSAPLTLSPELRRPVPTLGGTLSIARRSACDLIPLDAGNSDHRLRLQSYIWADQTQRLERLTAVLDHVARQPEKPVAADAADFVDTMLARPAIPGTLRVIFHSIFWQYLPEATRTRIMGSMKNAGVPIAWLRLEADGEDPGGGLRVTLWPTGEEWLLARGDYHGRWLDWRDVQINQ